MPKSSLKNPAAKMTKKDIEAAKLAIQNQKKPSPKPKAKEAPVTGQEGGELVETVKAGQTPVKKKGEGSLAKPKPRPKPIEKPKRDVIHPEVSVELYSHSAGNPITLETAMELIGWKMAPDDNPDWFIKDTMGNKIVLENNATNRPFRMGLAKRYANEMLRGKWKLNGETIIFDRLGLCQSGQHRLVALILAEEQRKAEPEVWKKYHRGPIEIEGIVVCGISEDSDTIDTLDIGQKRSLGDVIARHEFFGDQEVPKKTRDKMANILANGLRLVWLRAGGKKVSDAPHFPHSEAMDFLDDHPEIVNTLLYIWQMEGGQGQGGLRISKYVTLGYATGLMYLMGTSATDSEELSSKGVGALNFELMEKAKLFWAAFASGAGLAADNPILVLREQLLNISQSTSFARDEVTGMIIKAFNLWVDNKPAIAKNILMKKVRGDDGKERLAEDPRLGGLDIYRDEDDKPALDKVDYSDDPREGSQAKSGKWQVNDSCWVRQKGEDAWFGVIENIIKGEGKIGDTFTVVDDATGSAWDVSIGDLFLKNPSKV
jgi:hypothetical protein